MLSARVGQYFKWVGQSPEWVGHGLPGLGLEPPLINALTFTQMESFISFKARSENTQPHPIRKQNLPTQVLSNNVRRL